MSPRGEHLNNGPQSLSIRTGAHQHHGFQSAGSILRGLHSDLVVSKQKLRRAEAIACVRLKRQEANQNLGFASRPFVLCGLPIKKPGGFIANFRVALFRPAESSMSVQLGSKAEQPANEAGLADRIPFR